MISEAWTREIVMDMLRSLVTVAASYCTHDLTIKITWSKICQNIEPSAL